MIFKYTLTLVGIAINYNAILENLVQHDALVYVNFEPIDESMFLDYEFDTDTTLEFCHPFTYTLNGYCIEYETWFLKFIAYNKDLFFKNGVNELSLFIDGFYDGDQCNMEIFCNTFMKEIGQFVTSLPMSIHRVKKYEYKKWEIDLDRRWSKSEYKQND